MQKTTAIIAAAACILMLWMFRYDLQASGTPSAYVLDRWTGRIAWIKGAEIEPVTPAAPPPSEINQFLQGGK